VGLLDDLKKEVEDKEEEARQQDAALKAQQEFYATQLRPAMQRAHTYFAELVETLNTLDREVKVPYALAPPKERPLELKHGQYVFRSDDYENPYKLFITCDCAFEQSMEYVVDTNSAVASYAALLEEHKIPHDTKNRLDESHAIVSATFTVDGPLKVQMRLLASEEDQCIYIDLLNLDVLPVKRYKFTPQQIDDALLDRLARLLVREESRLIEVKVSEQTRAELQRKLAEEKRRLEEEQAAAEAHREAERQAEEEAKLINRAKRSVSGGLKKILSKD
jgi:hypothetical protein